MIGKLKVLAKALRQRGLLIEAEEVLSIIRRAEAPAFNDQEYSRLLNTLKRRVATLEEEIKTAKMQVKEFVSESSLEKIDEMHDKNPYSPYHEIISINNYIYETWKDIRLFSIDESEKFKRWLSQRQQQLKVKKTLKDRKKS